MGTCQPTLPKCEIMHTRDTVPQCSGDRPEVYAGIAQEAKPSFKEKERTHSFPKWPKVENV